MDYEAIRTKYNGIEYRSRLEARYAYLFDKMKIKFIYEPEGLKFKNGLKYLPDFYLPEQDMYVEVKGVLSGYDKQKILSFLAYVKKPLLFLNSDFNFSIMTNYKQSEQIINDICEVKELVNTDISNDDLEGIIAGIKHDIESAFIFKNGCFYHFIRYCRCCEKYYFDADYDSYFDEDIEEDHFWHGVKAKVDELCKCPYCKSKQTEFSRRGENVELGQSESVIEQPIDGYITDSAWMVDGYFNEAKSVKFEFGDKK